jgi:hypothetical protein
MQSADLEGQDGALSQVFVLGVGQRDLCGEQKELSLVELDNGGELIFVARLGQVVG